MTEQRIRIGNQTSRAARELMLPFEYAVENGFDAFEWFPDRSESGEGWQEKQLETAERAMIARTAARCDIRLSVHAPWWIDLAQPEALSRLLPSLELALDIKACVLNVHLCERGGIDAYMRGLNRLLDELEGSATRLTIENTPETGPQAFNELFDRLARVRPTAVARVGMCLDVGHANLAAATRNDFLRFVDELEAQVPVLHVHMHENFGDADTHLPLFTGPSQSNPLGVWGFVERMKRRGFSGSIILEQWPAPPTLLNRAREGLLAMFAAEAGCASPAPPRSSS
jgi:sugar phosphate isomerase/epimerase